MPRSRRSTIIGRTAVITGAASGIGRALARRLSRAGCPVALADVDAGGLKETAADLGGPVLTEVVDVADGAAMRELARAVAGWAPAPLGAVFNNAGVAVTSTVLDGSPEADEWLRRINFDGVVHGTRAFLPLLVAQDDGVIVNTSSVYGLAGVPFHSAYCAAKFAVRGFTDSLRQELAGTGVRAVVVHPGGIRTNIARSARTIGDPDGRGLTDAERADEFEAMVMTSPEKAAKIICGGIERGRSRILVGPDAAVFDLAVRIAPTRYMSILAGLESLFVKAGPVLAKGANR